MKISELTGAALDWTVAKCEGWSEEGLEDIANGDKYPEHSYSTDWAQGGPIIERENISVSHSIEGDWMGYYTIDFDMRDVVRGPTPLIAAMRCYTVSKLGDEVEVPDELA